MHEERGKEAGGAEDQDEPRPAGRPADDQPPLSREPRPFPALDPEPPHRFTWRAARRPAIALVAAGVVAAAVLAGLHLAGSPAPAAPRPVKFTDRDGLVVFEQASGQLGTADPDGGHPLIPGNVGTLQGNDLPVASPDGRYLVTLEGQLVTMTARGPASVTSLAGGQAEDPNADSWAEVSFAAGGTYIAATECDSTQQGPEGDLVAHLLPTAGGKPATLGAVTSAAGDPAAAGSLLSVTAGGAPAACDSQTPADQAVELATAGKPAKTLITGAVLVRALGWPAGTHVWLDATPNPDGSALIVSVTQAVALPTSPGSSGAFPKLRTGQVMVSRAGKVTGQLHLPADSYQLVWSPDGKQVATCAAAAGKPSTVSVLTAAGGAVKTITLPGHRDQECEQLLWSPDGTQLIYSGVRNVTGLTQADRVQHGWTVIDPRAGTAHDVAASGQPAAWLPGPGAAGGQGTP